MAYSHSRSRKRRRSRSGSHSYTRSSPSSDENHASSAAAQSDNAADGSSSSSEEESGLPSRTLAHRFAAASSSHSSAKAAAVYASSKKQMLQKMKEKAEQESNAGFHGGSSSSKRPKMQPSSSKSKQMSSDNKNTSKMKSTSNGQSEDSLRVSTIVIGTWPLTFEREGDPTKTNPYPHIVGNAVLEKNFGVTWHTERKLAVVNNERGFVIPKSFTHEQLIAFLTKLLPTAMNYLKKAGPYLNHTFDDFRSDPSEEHFGPLVLCIKYLKGHKAYPGKAGQWPTGAIIWEKCLSLSKGSWRNNWLVFCARVDLSDVAEDWMMNRSPEPPLREIRCLSSEEEEETHLQRGRKKARSKGKGKGKQKASAHSHSRSPSISAELHREVQRFRGNSGRLFLPTSSDGEDIEGNTLGDESSLQRRVTRSMTSNGSSLQAPKSHGLLDLTNNSDEEDKEDEDNVASAIVPNSSPDRQAYITKANSTAFLLNGNDSASVDVFKKRQFFF